MEKRALGKIESIDDPLEIALFRARIERAAGHHATFGQIWADHLESGPRAIEVEIDGAGNGRIKVVGDLAVPLELSLVLGEFLYELRAALDNCLYAVAVLESGQQPPPNAERLEWPICLDEASWRDVVRRRLAGLSPGVQEALAAIQPFMAGAPHWNCLRILHDLARVDRHRSAHLTRTFLASARGPVDTKHIAGLDVRLGVVQADGIVATFRKLTPGPLRRSDLDLNFDFEVETAEVDHSPHPTTGVPQRPWGPLDRRLSALLRAVAEYTEGLLEIARENVRAATGP
jgi:hypothetical protein